MRSVHFPASELVVTTSVKYANRQCLPNSPSPGPTRFGVGLRSQLEGGQAAGRAVSRPPGDKEYWAAVEGSLEPAKGIWENWLRKVPDQARAELVDKDLPGARFARTRYRVLCTAADRTLLELIPETGRMHQLRLQSSLAQHPVLGDILYGSSIPFGPVADGSPRERIIALHARRLSILHPVTFAPLSFTAPLPDYWRESLLPLPPVAFKSLNSDLGPRSPISG